MSPNKVFIFETETEAQPIGRPTSARGQADTSRVARAVELSADAMEANLTTFIETVASMLDKAEAAAGAGVRMDTVEVSVQVGADGKVGFMGVGLSAQASSSMKLVFKRE
ncbi:Pepco domain-containing protein [Ruegeria hyattellae]|jgi:hypothetical protein|uniref:Pepco domain-containing protein n=1 Tax=Ruegeria hyattellae TaxID=3233337 RepID=UPI00355B7FAF